MIYYEHDKYTKHVEYGLTECSDQVYNMLRFNIEV